MSDPFSAGAAAPGGRFDPRFPPAFQPGYEGHGSPSAPPSAAPTGVGTSASAWREPLQRELAQREPAQRESVHPAPAAQLPPAPLPESREERVAQRHPERGDHLDHPHDGFAAAEPATAARALVRNPFMIATWALSAVLLIAGASLMYSSYETMVQQYGGFATSDTEMAESYALTYSFGPLAPALIGAGLLGVILSLLVFAITTRPRD